ncbi:hypothetical protein SSAG_04432 [Streptomyces sp. Mg1]|nr:hypothetical protein SSAG_04432 [Streptomyces sp. Mg1]
MAPARAAALPQLPGGRLGTAPVHRELVAPPLLDPQVDDVRAQQDRRHRRGPQEAEPADGRDDGSEGEDEEEERRGAPAARQHLEALFAPGPLRPFHPLGRGRAGFRPGRGHAEDPGVGVHGIHRFRRRVRVRFGPGLRLLVTALPQPLGVTALHSRPAGKQPNGGGEAFRRTGFVQLVLPPEPHGHQVGGPGPDNDCVDEAAAAHPHTVEGRGRADPPIEPVCRTIRLISRTFFVILRIRLWTIPVLIRTH